MRPPRQYTLLHVPPHAIGIDGVSIGCVVYEQLMHDYGLANDDSRMFGVPFRSVTLNPAGGYPGFTVPATSIQEFKEQPMSMRFKPESQFAPGDVIRLREIGSGVGTVERVSFSRTKVTYDLQMTVGGEPLRNIDSTFVEAL